MHVNSSLAANVSSIKRTLVSYVLGGKTSSIPFYASSVTNALQITQNN